MSYINVNKKGKPVGSYASSGGPEFLKPFYYLWYDAESVRG